MSALDRDSLDEIDRELGLDEDEDEPGIASVPANLKPGPKGLSGGIALPERDDLNV